MAPKDYGYGPAGKSINLLKFNFIFISVMEDLVRSQYRGDIWVIIFAGGQRLLLWIPFMKNPLKK